MNWSKIGAASLPGFLLLACSVLWTGCGATTPAQTQTNSGGSPAVQVSLTPSGPSVRLGETLQFSATVTNAQNTAVTWSVNQTAGGNSTLGTIDKNGLYTAPATLPSPATVTVTATSAQDSTKSASTTVTLLPAVTVTVAPATATIAPGATQAFTATVTGDTNQTVTWSVNDVAGGNSTVGTIDASGNYTAPTTLPNPATVTISATSQADTHAVGKAQVTLAQSIQISVTPARPSVRLNETLQFTATVQNSQNTAVTWSVNGTAGGTAVIGTIDANGLYTAPATLPSPASVTITATSQADTHASGSTTVTLLPALTVTVTPATATVALKAKQAFTVTITGDTNQAVTWSVNGANGGNSTVGTIDASGNYTAPAALPSPATVTITATSQADTHASGSAQVTLKTPSTSMTISPATAMMTVAKAGSATQTFTVTAPDGFQGTIQLGASGVPHNVTAAWDTSSLTGSGTATLTLTSASYSLAQANIPVTITATATDSTGKTNDQTAAVNLSITGWKGQVRTLAGQPGGVGFEDGTGSAVELKANAITSDGAGTLYFIDGWGKAMRTLQLSSGAVATLVGSPFSFAFPYGLGVVWDASRQQLYASDTAVNVIFAYRPGDTHTTVLAGTGKAGAVDGPAASAQFNGPHGLALSPDHNTLYVADSGNQAIRAINLVTGTVTTIAGQLGTQGSQDGVGTAALLAWPWGLDIDPAGKYLYFSERYGPKIRRVMLADGTVTTLAGNGKPGAQDGPAASATFTLPGALRIDPHDNGADLLYVSDGDAIRALTLGSSPTVFTLAGSISTSGDQDGPGNQATFNNPQDLTVLPDLAGASTSSLFVADTDNGLIRRIDVSSPAAAASSGTMTATVTSVGGQPPHFGYVDGAGTSTDFSTPSQALFNQPQGISTDGKVAYLADRMNHAIRKIDLATHAVTTVAGGHAGYADGPALQAGFFLPSGVLYDPSLNVVFIADTDESMVRKLDLSTMTVSTIAGSNPPGFADGVGSAAHFNHPYGMAVTSDGKTLYVADVGNNAIRTIDLATNTVTTIAGHNYGYKDGVGLAAEFYDPTGLALSPDEKALYITDFNNHLIRKLDLTTMAVTTIAGQPNLCGSHDGIGTAATLCSPAMLTTDGKSLYWGDSLTSLVRVMSLQTGQVTTIFGKPGVAHLKDGDLTEVDGGLSGPVQSNEPFGVAVAPDGSFVLITDTHGNTVRILQ